MHPRPPVLLVSLLSGVYLHDEAGVGLGVVRQEGRRVDLVRVGDVPQGLVAVGLAVVTQAVDVLVFEKTIMIFLFKINITDTANKSL